jgi:hypothetical protein
VRQIGCLFLGLTFFAGLTVTGGSVQYGLINVVVFLILGLLVERLIAPRFGSRGVVYGMAGAFFASFLWPVALILSDDEGLVAAPVSGTSEMSAS